MRRNRQLRQAHEFLFLDQGDSWIAAEREGGCTIQMLLGGWKAEESGSGWNRTESSLSREVATRSDQLLSSQSEHSSPLEC